jgi:hypothetical protein
LTVNQAYDLARNRTPKAKEPKIGQDRVNLQGTMPDTAEPSVSDPKALHQAQMQETDPSSGVTVGIREVDGKVSVYVTGLDRDASETLLQQIRVILARWGEFEVLPVEIDEAA